MKKILIVLVISIFAVPLLAQTEKKSGCHIFGCEVLDGFVDDIGDGIKKFGQRTKKTKDKLKDRLSGKIQNSAEKQLQEMEQEQQESSEDLIVEQPFIHFNGKDFYATDISSKNGVIRNAYMYQNIPEHVLILRQYSGKQDPQPEVLEFTNGYPDDPQQIIFNDEFFKQKIIGEEETVATSRSPITREFIDYAIVRTVYLRNDITRQYIYRFRVAYPDKDDAAVERTTKRFLQSFDALKEFNPKELIKGNYSFN